MLIPALALLAAFVLVFWYILGKGKNEAGGMARRSFHVLSTRIHGMLDYVVSLLVIFLPWILGFSIYSAARWIMVFLGVGSLVYSLVTRYEFGFAGLISIRTHLRLDVLSGLVLAASPWLFGFADRVFLPHLIIGVMEVVVAMVTDPHPVKKAEPRLTQ